MMPASAPADYLLYERIYLVVEQIPSGKVATYGDIAVIVGGGCEARMVGDALGALNGERAKSVPWQRVINREGRVSTRGLQQRQVLEAEGIVFDAQERVIMARFRWEGPDAAWAETHGFQTLPPHDQAEQLSLF